MNEDKILQMLKESILSFDVEKAVNAAKEAIKANIDPIKAIEEGFTKGIREVGELFAKGEIFLPELIMAGEAMKAAIEILKPLIPSGKGLKSLGKVVIGTVAGDLHDIGKSIVVSMLTANGFEVYDLGVDVPTEAFIKKVKEVNANILGLSALLTSTLPEMKKIIDELKKEGLRNKVKVIIGGAATTQKYANEIGADAWAGDAIEAVSKIKELMGIS
ncbi:MAG: corrinoid protein [Nitrososphaerota archaeon]